VSGEFTDDPSAPVFFLSYARAQLATNSVTSPYDVNAHVRQLFTDLTAIVNELVPLLPGQDPGFMDTTLDGGEVWERRLLRAAGSCQVFIPLLSIPYLRSTWCAMEWDAFTRRPVTPTEDGRPDDVSGVLPVLWAPIVGAIPRVVTEVQRFTPANLPDPRFGPRYEHDGLLGLMRMGQEDAYQSIVWALARRIQHMEHTRRVKIDVPVSTDRLRRHFDEDAS
jgi:hypothetical protein